MRSQCALLVLVLSLVTELSLAASSADDQSTGGRGISIRVLHTLLGTLYQQTGLPRQAAEAFDEARFLMTTPK